MARSNSPQCYAAEIDLSGPQDQGQDVAMADATGGGAPHGGQDQDSHPNQERPPNLEALGPGDQEGQQPEEFANMNKMQGDAPPLTSLRDMSASNSFTELVYS